MQERESVRLPSAGMLHIDGPVTGAPVLLLHGVGGGAWSWKPQRAALRSACRVFTWEARGHGAAGRVADAGLSDYYADAREALDVALADCAQSVTVAGHSMGGLLAMALACDRPRDVAGLFLVDPVYADGTDGYGHFSGRSAKIARTLSMPLVHSFAHNGLLARLIARRLFALAFTDRARMREAWRDQRTQIPIEYRRMLLEAFDGPSGFELRDFASAIAVPTTLIGCDEHETRFPHLLESLALRPQSSFRYVVIAGGHYLQLDRPEPVTDELRRFLSEVSASRADGSIPR